MKYPSVTHVLSPYNDFSRIPDSVLKKASEKGTRIHAACAAHALCLPVPDLPDDDLGYYESFEDWFEASVAEVISVEQEYIDEKLGFMGHPDLVCRIKRCSFAVHTVVDYKTPATVSPSWRLQLAAYSHLTNAARCFSLRLNKDGKRAIVNEVKNWQRDFSVFLNALSVWRYFNG